MKKLVAAPLLALFAVLGSSGAFAQQYNPGDYLALDNPGQFQETSVLSIGDPTGNGDGMGTGYGTVGFDFDASGNLFYFTGPNDGEFQEDQIVEATAASGFAIQEPIANFSAPTYGAFLTVNGSNVYYGDGSYVYDSSTTVTNPTPAPNVLAAIQRNYDLAFSGSTAFLSANVSGTDNEVYAFNIATGAYKEILNTQGDYSGPIAFDSAGDLIYGATGAAIIGSGTVDDPNIYIFSKASVDAAETPNGSPLRLTNPTSMITGTNGNSDFAVVGNTLYDEFTPFGASYATLTSYNLSARVPTGVQIAEVTNPGYTFGGIGDFDGQLTVAVTDANTFTDFIDVTPVPEPGATSLGIAGLVIVAAATLRRRRATRETH